MPPTGGIETSIVHGTTIALDNRAVLLRGPSGAGKSDLALRAMAVPLACFGASSFLLVGDDQIVVRRSGADVVVRGHPHLAGLIEVRGLGILPVPHVAEATLVVVADLVATREIERLPDPWPVTDVLGVRLPVLRISPFEASAPLKLALAVMQRPWLTVAN